MRKYLFKGPVTTLQNITFIIFVRSKERLTDEEMVRSCLCKECIFYLVFSGDLYGTMLGKGRSRQWQVLYIYLSIFHSIYIYLSLKIPRGNKIQQYF